MDLKKLFIAAALAASPSYTPHFSVLQSDAQSSLSAVLSDSTGEEKSVYYTFEVSQELLHQIDTMCLDANCPVVFSRSLEDLRNTPLFMRGTRRHIGEFLWYDQYDNILKKYNADTIPDSLKTSEDLRINNFEHINFPLIYDEIGYAVPHTLDSLLQDDRFAEYRDTMQGNDTLIVEMKQSNWRYSLLYYETGKLILATYATLGRGKSTPKWLFQVDYKVEYKRSRKYNNASMPYALHVNKNVFIHQWKVAPRVNSHGCNRIPWLYAEALYYLTTAPKIWMFNNFQRHKLDSVEAQLCDSLSKCAPKVLILD